MQFRPIVFPAALLTVMVLSAASVPKPEALAVKGNIRQAAGVPVLVELFTSEGCSSCPAADELLRGLEATQPIPGVEVIPLEMHVDYWNGQGWRDPFALRQLTNRHNEYIRLFNLDNVFAPQVVVAGQAQILGSNADLTRQEIVRAAKGPRATVDVAFQSASVATVKIDKIPLTAKDCEIWMAVTESHIESNVGAGENNGLTLRHSSVVRSLVMLGRTEPGEPVSYTMHLRFNSNWKRDDLRYVVFVQDRLSRKIYGATAVAP
jgi:hypothetical protein